MIELEESLHRTREEVEDRLDLLAERAGRLGGVAEWAAGTVAVRSRA